MSEIATINDFEKNYPNEWIIFEVLEENELKEPTKGKLVAHSKVRDEIDEISKTLKGDFGIFFTGEIPKKGYAFCF